jgi:hypothetical protein
MSHVTDTPRPTVILALACLALLLAACGVMAPTEQPPAGEQPAATEGAPAEPPQPEEDTPPQPTEVIAQEAAPAEGTGEVKGADQPSEPTAEETSEPPVEESGEPPKVDCPGALPPRLAVGEPARVTFSNGLSVRVREEPSTDDSVAVLFMLPEGSVFTVIGGPVCAEHWLWWEIEMANGVSGWASEGSPDQGYFLEPYTP